MRNFLLLGLTLILSATFMEVAVRLFDPPLLHVGEAALLMSAVPQLKRQPALVRQYLTQSATAVSSTTCSSAGVPNNLYGSGRLNVFAAVQEAIVDFDPIFEVGFEEALE